MEKGGAAAEEKKMARREPEAAESLGWLTESSIMPKKHKAIEGVGASSIMELKAHLYKEQEEARKSRELSGPDFEYQRAKRKIPTSPSDPFSRKNSGVDARAHKDKLALKAAKDGTDSYAALEKKAQLYEKLVRGELSDEEDKEKYCVDFFRKGFMQEEKQDSHEGKPSAVELSGNEDTEDDIFNTRPAGLGRGGELGTVDNDERKRLVREVHKEANHARVKATELKMRRQEEAAARREKLKQAYLRKQLEKLKAASKAEQPLAP
ncbi:hypothetical protein AKJ16_DCAP18672 [Drosera capensis]